MALVSTEWLAEHLFEPQVRVCDVRWYLPGTGRSGPEAYAAGHVPGAAFIDLEADLSAADDGSRGRHPLPPTERFAASMGRAGIDETVHVVAYDDAGGSVAARLWWLLRSHGHEKVSLLDGGLTAWQAEGRPLEQAAASPSPRTFVPRPVEGSAIEIDAVREALRGDALLLDARAPERYRGETEPIDPRPGHIPGAVNAPVAAQLERDGRFLPREVLAERFRRLGADRHPVIASCGSGVTACHLLFALDESGVARFPAARLFVGSYSEWSRHPELPVATGDAPGQPA